jgi:hypothetical protein
MAGQFFGMGERRGQWSGKPVTSIPVGATVSHLPSADVLKGVDDERAVRRLRRKLRIWRLLGRVR